MKNDGPIVGIIMGSDSDLPKMEKARENLKQLEVRHEISIISAHRTPKKMFDYAQNAEKNGFRVIIAGAGGAAHLPGMVASLTLLPVIGVPISATKLEGQDSLLSIVQMPFGIPVATVGIDNSGNAALLAAQILSLHDEKIRANLQSFRSSQTEHLLEKASMFAD